MNSMCGRFSITTEARILAERFDASLPPGTFPPRFNVAPSQDVPVILNRAPHSITFVTWGFIPHWARQTSRIHAAINARVESVGEKPMFREAFRHMHCLVLADGFYEWKKEDDGTKVPYRIVLKSREPFAFAGIWDESRNAEGHSQRTCAILTTEAHEAIAPIHHRMPIILKRNNEHEWLLGLEDTPSILEPIEPEHLNAYEISTRINNPRNNSKDVIEPANSTQHPFQG